MHKGFSTVKSKTSDTRKLLQMWFYHRTVRRRDADKMANSVDPDQTVLSGSTLFAKT